MSLLIFIAAALQNAPSTVPSNTAPASDAAAQQTAPRRKARATLVASATIIRHEKVNPLIVPAKPTEKVERPIAQQYSVKSGVPYVEFY